MSDWILCSERLPEQHKSIFSKLKGTNIWSDSMFEKVSKTVIATCLFKKETVVVCGRLFDNKWRLDNHFVKSEDVIAWMPLPEPYKEV